MSLIPLIKSIAVFILAGFCEIGGGYMVWLCLKQGRPAWYGVLGSLILAFYGIVATWQPSNFGRSYATYGGIFIVMAMIWAYKFDGFIPDRYDIIGAVITLLGICIIFYTPR